ncbi:hypothetical protein BC833DRAFT_620508 [Globomyces pollinis-pini]|nr:hypothetical protein BC833DRAFT_620508 [Globomyces pollinis-pini]
MEPTIRVGDVVPFESITTIQNEVIELNQSANGLIHLHFARHSGCPICNYHLKKYSSKINIVKTSGVLPVFVFHSKPDTVRKNQGEVPWAKDLHLVGDGTKAFYKKLGIDSSKVSFLNFRSMFIQLKYMNIFKFQDQGDELGTDQRPMDLLIDSKTGIILEMKYGVHPSDRWDVQTVLQFSDKHRQS